MQKETETITLPSGKVVEYRTTMNAGMYLDLQDIPGALAGTRVRYMIKSLVVSIDGETDKSKINDIVTNLTIEDINEVSTPMIEILNNPDGVAEEDKKKGADGPVASPDEGDGSADAGTSSDGGTS